MKKLDNIVRLAILIIGLTIVLTPTFYSTYLFCKEVKPLNVIVFVCVICIIMITSVFIALKVTIYDEERTATVEFDTDKQKFVCGCCKHPSVNIYYPDTYNYCFKCGKKFKYKDE